jgi:mono/diheme cytochrome c family protein
MSGGDLAGSMRIFTTILILLVIAIVGFVWFGVFNVAATEQHSDFTLSLIAIVRDRSIAMRATAPQPPPTLTDPELIKKGFASYHTMCSICHSAPGRKASPIRRGLNPKPPKLDSRQVQHRNDTELYWIIEHGMRMTGMPAFGPTHRPEAIWSLVAFVRELPKITPQQYQEMIHAAGLKEDEAADSDQTPED